MTTLERLRIAGIRSFSPTQSGTIEFFRPLTLIVGANGAGKTTIIECLKWATTGDLPPNASFGRAFVHDLKMANELEVKASVRLKFQAISGRSMTVSKQCLVRKAKTKIEFKVLDALLVVKDADGPKTSRSLKSTELDKDLPSLLGVAKPILENVIFCHQEESSWPLGDPTDLKKRFDAIFATTRYSKALVEIREREKELRQAIRVKKAELDAVEAKRSITERLQTERNVLVKRIEIACENIQKLTAEIQEAQTVLRASEADAKAEAELVRHMDSLNAKRDEMARTNQQLYEDLPRLFTDEDDYLESWRENLGREVEEKEGEISRRVELLEEEDADIRKEEQRIAAFSERRARVTAGLNGLYRLLSQRDQALVAAGTAAQCAAPSPEEHRFNALSTGTNYFSENQILGFTHAIEASMRERRLSLESFSNEESVRVEQTMTEISDLTAQLRMTEKEIKEKEKEAKAHAKRSSELEREANGSTQFPRIQTVPSLPVNASLDEVEDQLSREEQALASHLRTTDRQVAQSRIAEKESRRREVDAALALLAQEMRRLHSSAARTARRNEDRARSVHAREELNRLLESSRETLEVFVGPMMSNADVTTVERRLEDAIGLQSRAVASAQKENERVLLKRAKEEQKVSAMRAEVDSRQAELDRLRASFTAYVPSWEERLNAAERAHRIAQRRLDGARSSSVLYSSLSGDAREMKACPVCERPLDPEGLDVFEERLTAKCESLPGLLEELKISVSNNSEALDALRARSGDRKRLCELVDSLPAFVNQFQELEEATNRMIAESGAEGAALADARLLLESMQRAVPIAAKLSHLASEEERAAAAAAASGSGNGEGDDTEEDDSVENLVGQALHGSVCARSLQSVSGASEHLRKEQESVVAELDALRREVRETEQREENCRRLREMRDVLTKRRDASIGKQEESALVQQLASTVRGLKRSCDIMKNSISSKTISCKELRTALQTGVKNKQKVIATIENSLKSFQEKETEKGHLLRSVLELLPAVERGGLNERLEAFVHDRDERQLETLKKRRDALAEIKKTIDADRRQVQDKDILLRSVVDNLRYRERMAVIKTIEAEIAVMEKQRAGFAGVTQRREQALGVKNGAEQELARWEGVRVAYTGEKNAKEQELAKPEHRETEELVYAKSAEVSVTELAIADCDKYYNALDKALSAFHTEKMKEINRIMKELWQSTYQGADVDAIEIRVEVDGATRARAASKAFLYRLVMIKGDASMDMRGRCSAGQKVLGCLIVRLALAETFGASCGILALDEPTTNLDRANVDAFANALLNIVQRRSAQRTFQLIIITHDEDFVEHLGGHRQFCDNYYRVSKDERQCSVIEKQPL